MNNFMADIISMNVNGIDVCTFTIPVKYLCTISYVAVRGKDEEEGAVQRLLNKKRISSIKQYVLDGNMFVNTFVINWVDEKNPPVIKNSKLNLTIVPSAAQLIDGQHRLVGIEEAMNVDPSIGDKVVMVTMATGLLTKQAAQIFLNINSEQKPVAKSLIYDLYGVTEDDKNFAISRSNDIAKELNENSASPFYNAIKYPGMPRGRGKIDLSAVVSALKNYVDFDGAFPKNNIRDFNMQVQIMMNYFGALKFHADKEDLWSNSSQNVFYKAAGFIGAMEFFFEYVIQKCVAKKSFKLEYIISLFDYANKEFISTEDIKGSDGKTARKVVKANLEQAFVSDIPEEDDYEF